MSDEQVPYRGLPEPGVPLYAHTPPEGRPERWHSLPAHLIGTGQLAEEFASAFGAGPFGRLLGLTHDIGKAVLEVQTALRSAAVVPRRTLGCPHKAEGAALAIPLLADVSPGAMWAMWLANTGHHAGIPGRTSGSAVAKFMNANRHHLDELLSRAEEELGISLRSLAADIELPAWVKVDGNDASALEMFTRMCHSALVDADFLDTEAHFKLLDGPRRSPVRGTATLRDTFMATYHVRYGAAADSDINRVRRHYFEASVRVGREGGAGRGGIYRLPAATGTGKTMAAAAFALEHAAEHGKRRVIVAVPFTSITTQNAQEYRAMFEELGDDIVLEHHSNILDDEIADDSWRRFSATNWDAEFVVTTTVQLFESLFSNRPSVTRKLHRLVDSVIVIDEVQALPLQLVPAILGTLRELAEHYGVTVLLASATQPAFWDLPVWSDFDPVDVVSMDYTPPVTQRVRYEVRTEEQTWSQIAEELADVPRALAIVNTTADAQALHHEVAAVAPAEVPVRHLSTRMCPRHRADVLEEVRRRLGAQEPILLVSTQVIEAGVDVDFPVVMRALAPADSIVQSAGRCNREGRLGERGGRVVVFRPSEGRIPLGDYEGAAKITRSQFIDQPMRAGVIDLGAHFDDPSQMTEYFRELYRSRISSHGGVSAEIGKLRSGLQFPETEDKFRMIENTGLPVIVTGYGPEGDRRRLGRILDDYATDSRYFPDRGARRLLQAYTATAPRHLPAATLTQQAGEGPLSWTGEYDDAVGLVVAVGEATIW